MGAATVRVVGIICAVSLCTALASCRAGGDTGGVPGASAIPPILLFNGTGTSRGDVAAIQRILANEGLEFGTANSSQLNKMSAPQMRGYRLLIIPGGNFVQIGSSLKSSTAANIRSAVQNGLNYLGICAGAFFAGNSPFNGLNLTSGSRFPFYAAENRGIRKEAVPISIAGGQVLDQYWEDGPQLIGWGAVVGKYPDGTPAIVEGTFGNGCVILTGVHPEAPASWRRGLRFRTPANIDNAYAVTLIRAALDRHMLPHY